MTTKEALDRFKKYAFEKGYIQKDDEHSFRKTRDPQSKSIRMIGTRGLRIIIREDGVGIYEIDVKEGRRT